MTEFFYFFLVIFVVGALIGSFLNVCIYRIPAGKSIVTPASCCQSCSQPIRWYHNIPIVSWLLLCGRCANCHQTISARYPFVEFLNALLYGSVFFYYGLTATLLVFCLFVSSLVVITFIDLDHQIIPDVISLPGILVGFACSFAVPWVGWFDSLLGILLGGGLLLAIAWGYQMLAKREGMGGGDIKLLAMIGAFLGWKAIFPVIFLASLGGTLIGVPLMLVRRENARLALPFGPFLSLAAVIYLLFGPQLIHWYFGFLK